MDSTNVDLILVGHLAKDEVVIRGAERVRQGGAVFFGAFAARAAGARCLVVTKLADADRPLLGTFADAGIEVHATPSAHTAGIRNVYTTADQDRRQCLLLHGGDPFRLEEIPPVRAAVIHVGALLAGQVPEALLEPLAARAPLGLDVQGFLRVDDGDELRLRPWPGAATALRHVTYLKADAAEAEVLTGLTDRQRAAEALARLGPREVVLTHATEVVVLADGELHRAPFDPTSLEGRTGRGDTCMAAYLAVRAQGHPAEWATRYAAALTSLKLEVDGPFGGTDAQVRARMGVL
jgi:sugar/nucleoside kinase (ribokinase family)